MIMKGALECTYDWKHQHRLLRWGRTRRKNLSQSQSPTLFQGRQQDRRY